VPAENPDNAHSQIESTQVEKPEDGVRKVVVKGIYSDRLKREVKKFIKDHGTAKTFFHYSRKIPRATLYDWEKANGLTSKQGRKTLLTLLEDELFTWFLKLRL